MSALHRRSRRGRARNGEGVGGALARASLPVVLVLSLVGCGVSPGGPEYTELGIQVEDAATNLLSEECTPLPVLPGGIVERDLALAPGLSAHVLATRDSADVTLSGITESSLAHVAVTQAELYRGYARSLAVTTLEGQSYALALVSPCTSPARTP